MRGYGYVEDPRAVADLWVRTAHVGLLLGRDASAPDALDLTGYLDRVVDQGPTNACVGVAMASALYLAGKARGEPIPRPSALAIYANARLYDLRGDLVDMGCRPSAAVGAAMLHGIVAEERWPFDARSVDYMPPFDVYTAGADAIVTGHYRIGPTDDVVTLMRRALVAGHFPVFGMPVDQAFEDWSTSDVYGREGQGVTRGRHMVCVTGFRPDAFLVLNSWGPSWGNGGFVWVANEWMASRHVSDRIVFTAAPRVR